MQLNCVAGPPSDTAAPVRARIRLKDGGSAKDKKAGGGKKRGGARRGGEGIKGSLNALNNALAAHTNIKKRGERKKERVQERKLSLTA